MNLRNKKQLAANTLGVGKKRIFFDGSRANEIKEAITKQDIKELHKEGVIKIKEKSGRRKIKKGGRKKGPGRRKRRINLRKEKYVKLTRKLRKYLYEIKKQGKINRERYWGLRKKIRAGYFKSKKNLKEHLENEG